MIDENTQAQLTKRELFAAMAMQGIRVKLGSKPSYSTWIAEIAVEDADALIKELEENKED